jgi:hypothetical protein
VSAEYKIRTVHKVRAVLLVLSIVVLALLCSIAEHWNK